MLSQRCLRWLGNVHPSRVPRAILYIEHSKGSRPVARPCLPFKDVCNRRDNMQAGIDPSSWEEASQDRSTWWQTIASGISLPEEKHSSLLQEKRQRRKPRAAAPTPCQASPFVSAYGGRDCHLPRKIEWDCSVTAAAAAEMTTSKAQSIVSTDGRMPTTTIHGRFYVVCGLTIFTLLAWLMLGTYMYLNAAFLCHLFYPWFLHKFNDFICIHCFRK